MPELEKLRRDTRFKDLSVLALSLEPSRTKVRAAVDRMALAMPVAIADSEVLAPLGVSAVPSTVFVSPEGRIVARASGYRGPRFLEARMRELLPSSATRNSR